MSDRKPPDDPISGSSLDLTEEQGELFLRELDGVIQAVPDAKRNERPYERELTLAAKICVTTQNQTTPEGNVMLIKERLKTRIGGNDKNDKIDRIDRIDGSTSSSNQTAKWTPAKGEQEQGVLFWRLTGAALVAVVAGTMMYSMKGPSLSGEPGEPEDTNGLLVKQEGPEASEDTDPAGDKDEAEDPKKEPKKDPKDDPKPSERTGLKKTDPKWKMEIRKKLERKVSFEFVDTPLEEALAFLNTLSEVNIILDPGAAEAGCGKVPINLKVSDMDMSTALRWILKLSQLEYDLRNRALFIFHPDHLSKEPGLEVYDLQKSALHKVDWVDLLQKNLFAEVFTDPATTVAVRDRKLVVMQKARVQAQIRNLLAVLSSETLNETTADRGVSVTSGSEELQRFDKGEKTGKWMEHLQAKLKRKVSFEFVDTPFDEAIAFLRNLSEATMIIRPQVLEAGVPPINLRVTDMELKFALDWIVRSAGCKWKYRDRAIIIHKPADVGAEMRVYGIRALREKGGKGADGTNRKVSDLILNTIRSESWNPKKGRAIAQVGDKLVVKHTPEIHAMIEKLLRNLQKKE